MVQNQPKWTLVAGSLLFLSLVGCGPPPMAYRLAAGGPAVLLYPPRPTEHKNTPAQSPPRDIVERLRLPPPPNPAACSVQSTIFSLSWSSSSALLEVHEGKILTALQKPVRPEAAPGSVAEVAPATSIANLFALPLLRDVQSFHNAIDHLSTNGCLSAAAADAILARITQTVPLPPALALYIRYGTFLSSDFIELLPGFRLKAVLAMRGANGHLAGYETDWYNVGPRPQGGEVIRRNGERRRALFSSRTRNPVPAPLNLNFPVAAKNLGLVMLIAQSSADHPVLIVGARSKAALDAAAARVHQSPALCATLGGDAWCRVVPYGSMVTAEIPVKLQGHATYVPLGLTIGEAISNTGIDPAAQLQHLEILRKYRSRSLPIRFDRRQTAILGLPLVPGDSVRW